MAQENLEKLHQAVDAVSRHDRVVFMALCAPEFVNIPPDDWPESEPARGREAVWDFYMAAGEAWEETTYNIIDSIDAGNDKIAVQMRADMRGKASGAGVTWSYWQVVTFRDGKAVLSEWFTEREEALEGLGLRE